MTPEDLENLVIKLTEISASHCDLLAEHDGKLEVLRAVVRKMIDEHPEAFVADRGEAN